MRKQLIISVLLLCVVQKALGQCGSAHDTDLDGSFVSSTSSDHCSGGIALLQGRLHAPGLQQQTGHDKFRVFDSFADPTLIFLNEEYFGNLASNFVRVDQPQLLNRHLKKIATKPLVIALAKMPWVAPNTDITVLLLRCTRCQRFPKPSAGREARETEQQIAPSGSVSVRNGIRASEFVHNAIGNSCIKVEAIPSDARKRSWA